MPAIDRSIGRAGGRARVRCLGLGCDDVSGDWMMGEAHNPQPQHTRTLAHTTPRTPQKTQANALHTPERWWHIYPAAARRPFEPPEPTPPAPIKQRSKQQQWGGTGSSSRSTTGAPPGSAAAGWACPCFWRRPRATAWCGSCGATTGGSARRSGAFWGVCGGGGGGRDVSMYVRASVNTNNTPPQPPPPNTTATPSAGSAWRRTSSSSWGPSSPSPSTPSCSRAGATSRGGSATGCWPCTAARSCARWRRLRWCSGGLWVVGGLCGVSTRQTHTRPHARGGGVDNVCT